MIKVRALLGKVDSMQEQMGNVSRDEDPKEKVKEILEIKNTVKEMKYAVEGFISRLDIAGEKNL